MKQSVIVEKLILSNFHRMGLHITICSPLIPCCTTLCIIGNMRVQYCWSNSVEASSKKHFFPKMTYGRRGFGAFGQNIHYFFPKRLFTMGPFSVLAFLSFNFMHTVFCVSSACFTFTPNF